MLVSPDPPFNARVWLRQTRRSDRRLGRNLSEGAGSQTTVKGRVRIGMRVRTRNQQNYEGKKKNLINQFNVTFFFLFPLPRPFLLHVLLLVSFVSASVTVCACVCV